MSILSLFVVIPVLMLLGLWIARNLNQVRGVMVAGSSCLLALSVWLTVAFIQARQSGNTDEMIFDPFDLIAELSRFVTLAPGDLVFTGTPGGAGNVRSGDRIRAGVNGVGSLNVEIV